MKSELAKAIPKWFVSNDGKKCCEGKPSGQFLRNRLERAFIAGADFSSERIRELEAELEQHRWIPVSERLPENVADVFILTCEGSGGIGMYGEDENGFGWERFDDAIDLNITHWKPIITGK